MKSFSGSKIKIQYQEGDKIKTISGIANEICLLTESSPFIVLEVNNRDVFINLMFLIRMDVLKAQSYKEETKNVVEGYR